MCSLKKWVVDQIDARIELALQKFRIEIAGYVIQKLQLQRSALEPQRPTRAEKLVCPNCHQEIQ